MPWDVVKAIRHLRNHAQPASTSRCAHYVQEAIEAGGVKLIGHLSAKDYGSSLTAVGFKATPAGEGYVPPAGDVGIVRPIHGHPHGHMAMYDGEHWISDFVQRQGLYPGSGYRKAKPAYTIYRYPFVEAGSHAALHADLATASAG